MLYKIHYKAPLRLKFLGYAPVPLKMMGYWAHQVPWCVEILDIQLNKILLVYQNTIQILG